MKKVFIKSAVSITCQDTFLNGNLASQPMSATEERELQEPNYRDFIAAAMIRRASKMMKMSLASSQACMEQAKVNELGAIIVGSGLGCMMDTEKFLKTSITAEAGSLLPPGAFIQSGHNSVSGQIALLLKNQKYNMTHVQKGLSFEYALMDALLRIKEGDRAVLLGGVDEKIEVLDQLAEAVNAPAELKSQLAEGCSFFVLGDEDGEVEVVESKRVSTAGIEDAITSMLDMHSLKLENSLGNFVGLNEVPTSELSFPHTEYTEWIGRYFSSSAFGLHLAYDKLKNEGESGDFTLLINMSDASDSALTLLRRV